MIVMKKMTHCYICSDKGNYRDNNEDSFVFNDRIVLSNDGRSEETLKLKKGWSVICALDGMGGTKEGRIASYLAASVFAGLNKQIFTDAGKREIDDIIRNAFLKANNDIVSCVRYSGTTATMLITDGRQSKLYHLGDSRAYLIRRGRIRQLTKDQTVEEMKKSMGLSKSIIETDKHRLTEFIGADESMQGIHPIESEWMPFLEGDRMILCTDGLYEGCNPQEILELVDNTEPRNVASCMVDLAMSKNVRDNITCAYIC